jgi:predicted ATP-grasp superfamily ATP-dependent carboligase
MQSVAGLGQFGAQGVGVSPGAFGHAASAKIEALGKGAEAAPEGVIAGMEGGGIGNVAR